MASATPSVTRQVPAVMPLGISVTVRFRPYPPTPLSSVTWYVTRDGTTTTGGTVTTGSGSGWTLYPVTEYGSTISWELTLDTSLIASRSGGIGANELLLSVNDGTSGESAIVSAGTVNIYRQPQLTITAPADGSTVEVLPLTLSWSVSDVDGIGIGDQTVIVQGTAGILSQLHLDKDVRQVSWHASELPLVSGEEYVIRYGTTDGMGMGIGEVVNFSTEWASPLVPKLVATAYNDTATIDVEVSAESGTTTNVWRVIGDELHLLGTVAGTSGTVTDPLPPIGVDVIYEAQSIYDETGTSSDFGTVLSGLRGNVWALNFGDGASELVRPRFNPQASYSMDHGGEAYHFADGGAGGGLPVWYGLTERDESGSIKWETKVQSEVDRLRVLSLHHPVGWLRDPFGHRWRAHIVPSASRGITKVWSVSVNWDAVRWEEA